MNDEPQYLSNPKLMVGQTIAKAETFGDETLLLEFKSGLRMVICAKPWYDEAAMLVMDGDPPSLGEQAKMGWISQEEHLAWKAEATAVGKAAAREARERQYLNLKKEFEPTD